MEDLVNAINRYTPTFLLVGGIVGMIVFIIFQLKYKTNKVSISTIETYEKRVKQLEDEARRDKEDWEKELQAVTLKMEGMQKQISEMTGTIKEKNDRIKQLEEFVHNSNPAMAQFIEVGTRVALSSEIFMKAQGQAIKEIHDGVVKIEGILTPGPAKV